MSSLCYDCSLISNYLVTINVIIYTKMKEEKDYGIPVSRKYLILSESRWAVTCVEMGLLHQFAPGKVLEI